MALKVVILVAVAAALALLQGVDSAVFNVGDSFGWRPPSGGFTFQNWAAQQTFVVGDTLVFNFATGRHTAALVSQSDYDNCNTASPITLQTTGPANFTLGQLGQSFFICTIPNHCSLGQKLAVNVVSSAARSPAGSPAPQPSGGTTPSGVNNGPSPRRNSATPTAVAASALTIFSFALCFFLF